MKLIALLGAGGHGKVAAEIAEQLGWGAIHFFDKSWPELSKCGHWDIVGGEKELLEHLSDYQAVFVSIGDNKVRKDKVKLLENADANLISLISPAAIISKYTNIENASLVVQGAIINAYTTLGKGVIVNTGACIDHDCVISNFAHICPNVSLAGEIKVGDNTLIGIGSSVTQQVKIGSETIVGAGSVVIRDIPNQKIACGVPAKVKGQ